MLLHLAIALLTHPAQELQLAQAVRMFPRVPAASRFAAGDFDGDGDSDVAVLTQAGLYTYFGDQGQFSLGAEIYDVQGESLEGFRVLEVVEFNDDAALDLVVSNGGTHYVFANDGSGQFTLLLDLQNWDGFTSDVLAADFDADGDVDFIEGASGFGRITLRRNLGSDFFPGETALNVEAHRIAAADMDVDGDFDVVASIGSTFDPYTGGTFSGSTYVGHNDGLGEFDTVPTSGAVEGIGDLKIGDLDGDGYPDAILAATSGPSRYLVNNTEGGLFATPSQLVEAASDIVEVVLFDLESDGDLDVYLASGAGDVFAPGLARDVLLQNTGGPELFVDASDRIPEACCYGQAALSADLNADGFADLLIGDGPSLFLTGADGQLYDGAGVDVSVRPSTLNLALADIDGDGIDDAFHGQRGIMRVLTGTGEGTFVAGSPILGYNTLTGSTFVAEDIDGDGDSDLFITRPAALDRLIRTETFGFTDVSMQQLPPQPIESSAALFADLDGNGGPDLAVVAEGSAGNRLYMNDGQGRFLQALDFPTTPGGIDVVALDVELDGDLDLACLGGDLLINDGAGTFIQSALPAVDSSYEHVAAGDLDADGDADLVLGRGTDSAGTSGLVLWNENGVFDSEDSISVPGFGPAAIVDLEADGDADIVFADGSINLGAGGSFDPLSVLSAEEAAAGTAVFVRDLDSDGDLDVLVPGAFLLSGLSRHLAWRTLAIAGKALELEVYGDSLSPFLLFASTAPASIPLAELGTILIDPDAVVAAQAGEIEASGSTVVEVSVPLNAALVGLSVYWQSASGQPLRVSNRTATPIIAL